jgi:tetratricopeptide (TPR) repeat protein
LANRSGDAQEDWLGHAVADLISIDLSQDLFVDSRRQYEFADEIKKTGATPGDALPLGLQQQLAREANLDFIVFGSFTREGRDFVVDLSLAPTHRGTPIAERQHRGPDLFKLVDEASLQLRRDLGIPAAEIESATDLPVAEIVTHSLPALRAHTLGLSEWLINANARASLPLFEQAVKLDPTFAQSWFMQAMVLFWDNRQAQMAPSMAAVKKNEYRLSEQQRFSFQSMYAVLGKDPAAELAILRQWVTLYPDDLTAHLALMGSYLRRDRLDEAKAEAAQVIALDPGNPRYLLELGRVYEIKGDNASAVEQYLSYQKKAPTDPNGYVRAAAVYTRMARHDDAMKSYEKALAVAPDDITAIVGMSEVQMQTGRMELAQATLDRGLKQSPGDDDKVQLLDQQARLWGVQGKWQRAVDETRKSWTIVKATQRQMTFLQRQLDQMLILVHAGRAGEALATIHQAETASDNVNVTIAVAVALADVYTELSDAAHARAAIDKLDALIKTYDIEQMQWVAADYRGRVADIEGAYAAAIASYEQALAHDPSDEQTLLRVARCRRMLKQYKDAHALLARALARFPAMPLAHDELARLYVDEGDRKQAGVEIAAALKVWADADPGYVRAADAQKLAAELRAHP